MKKLTIGLLFIIALFAGSKLFLLGWYVFRGHYIGSEGVSEYIASNNLDPLECNKIELNPFDFAYPSRGSRRSGCIHGVAILRKDPAICQLLMPSEYGIDCIKNTLPPVEGPEIGINCEDRDNKMFCYSSYDALLAHNQDIVIDFTTCEKITDINKRDWCYIGRVRTIPDEKDCGNVVLNQDHKDFCIYALAMKTKDAGLCQNIRHETRRMACEMLLTEY
ncbi:hypothetical protein HYW84_00595 [Candidatus Peregrinibacteria bacterium]|nr:hypothetical protein [Candidatus Peregrinibacteria bacterium]